MKFSLIWGLPLLWACGSSAQLAEGPSRENHARIQWIRPAPIAVREVENVGRSRSDDGSAGSDPVGSTLEPSMPALEAAAVPDAMMSAGVNGNGPGLDATSPSSPLLPSVSTLPPTAVIPSHPEDDGDTPRSEKPMNKDAVTGAILGAMGTIGMLFHPAFFFFGIVAFIFGVIAIVQIPKRHERGLFLAIWACLSLFAILALVLAMQQNVQG